VQLNCSYAQADVIGWCGDVCQCRRTSRMPSESKRVLFVGLKFSSVISNLWILIRRIKHRLIIKLITQIEANLPDESIKPN
jgi:hypothetical protein